MSLGGRRPRRARRPSEHGKRARLVTGTSGPRAGPFDRRTCGRSLAQQSTRRSISATSARAARETPLSGGDRPPGLEKPVENLEYVVGDRFGQHSGDGLRKASMIVKVLSIHTLRGGRVDRPEPYFDVGSWAGPVT